MFCPEMKWKCDLLDYNYIYTVTITVFTYVCKLCITYSVHKKLQFLLLELLQFGTKDAWLFMQRKSTNDFMVQWSEGFIFFKTRVKTIRGNGGKRRGESDCLSSFLIRNAIL